jgi:outer membrane protein
MAWSRMYTAARVWAARMSGGLVWPWIRASLVWASLVWAAPMWSPLIAAQRTPSDRLPLSAVRQVEPAQPASRSRMRPLTIDDAERLALEKNLDIAVDRANPQTFDLALSTLRAAYLPTISSLVGGQQQTAAPVTLLTGGQRVTTTTGTINGQLTDNLPQGGGSLSLTWNNNRVASNSAFYNYNPAFNTTLTAQYTQPILRGLRTDAARRQIVVTQINREISAIQVETTIANTLTGVREAYWDLVYAVQAIDVAAKSVETAHALVDENQKRLQYGTMTRLDLVAAQSQEATSRHALVQAEGNRRTAELALKRLLVGGPEDPLWQETIDPVDRPDEAADAIDIDAAVKRALARRTDLAQARQQAAANTATIGYLRDQAKPQLDLVASYALTGLGGTQLLRPPGTFFNAPVVGTIPGSYDTAISSLFGRNYPTWGVALTASYPVGFNAAKAESARAAVQQQQVDIEIRKLEVQIVTEVTNAAIQARNSADQVRASSLARQLADEKLDAEQKKFAAGMSTNYFVVQAQKDLADARIAELQALVAYRKALVELDRAQQTSLQSAGVTIASPAGLVLPAVGSGRPANNAPSGSIIP